jgi:hypothetical protein
MKAIVNFLLPISVFSAFFISAIYGFEPAIIYLTLVLFISLIIRVYSANSGQINHLNGRKEFFNRRGLFQVFDIVYDRGSATRPNEPGVLKYSEYDKQWYIVYSDAFEWPLSEFENIEAFKPNK